MASLHQVPSAADECDAKMPAASVLLEPTVVGRAGGLTKYLRMRRYSTIAAAHEPSVSGRFLAHVLQGQQSLRGTVGSEQPFAERSSDGGTPQPGSCWP